MYISSYIRCVFSVCLSFCAAISHPCYSTLYIRIISQCFIYRELSGTSLTSSFPKHRGQRSLVFQIPCFIHAIHFLVHYSTFFLTPCVFRFLIPEEACEIILHIMAKKFHLFLSLHCPLTLLLYVSLCYA
jgi:hypothetical protein